MASSRADRNDALVREFLSAWERRDTEHIMPCWTRFEQVPGGRLEIHHQVASDDIVITERTDRITFRGRQLVVPICAVFEIRDGRIAAWREYFDPALFASP